MKRPLACIGFGAFSALAIAATSGNAVIWLAAVFATVSAVLLALRIFCNKSTLSYGVFFLSAVIALVGFMLANSFVKQPIVDEFSGQTVYFSGVITSSPYTDGTTTRFTVRTLSVNGENCRLNLRLSTGTVPNGGIYDFIGGTVSLAEIEDDDSGLNYTSYNDARHIFLSGYIPSYGDTYYYVTKNDFPPVWKIFSDTQRKISACFYRYLPYNEASLCTSMITGDRSGLSDEIMSRFRTLGVAHLLVVSGLHLSVLIGLLEIFLKNLTVHRVIRCFIEFAAVVCFAAVTGFGFSVRRALCMAVFMILSRLCKYTLDPINTLGLAALLFSFDPFCAGDVGLLWSFSCTFSIMALTDKFSDRISEAVRSEKLSDTLSVTFAAFAGSFPFVMLVARVLSPYTVLANLLTVPFTGIIVVVGGLGAALSLIYPPLYILPMIISGLAAKYLLFVTEKLMSLPFSGITLSQNVSAAWVIASIVIISILIILFQNKNYVLKYGTALSVSALCIIFAADIVINNNRCTLYSLDTGAGLTVVFDMGESCAVLSANGDRNNFYSVKSKLSDFNKISFIVDVTAENMGYNYNKRIVSLFGADKVFVNDEKHRVKYYSQYEYDGGDVEMIEDDYTLYISDDATLYIYSGENVYEYLKINDTGILICDSVKEDIPSEFLEADIAVVRDSDTWDRLEGTVKVIDVGTAKLNVN